MKTNEKAKKAKEKETVVPKKKEGKKKGVGDVSQWQSSPPTINRARRLQSSFRSFVFSSKADKLSQTRPVCCYRSSLQSTTPVHEARPLLKSGHLSLSLSQSLFQPDSVWCIPYATSQMKMVHLFVFLLNEKSHFRSLRNPQYSAFLVHLNEICKDVENGKKTSTEMKHKGDQAVLLE